MNSESTPAEPSAETAASPLPPMVVRRVQLALAFLLVLGLAAIVWNARDTQPLRATNAITNTAARFVVDPNRAEWTELTLLPGIGETLAKRIVDHREANGPFKQLSDLRRVRGIGPAKLEQMRPYLTFDEAVDNK